jgi:hypothetical protein
MWGKNGNPDRIGKRKRNCSQVRIHSLVTLIHSVKNGEFLFASVPIWTTRNETLNHGKERRGRG